MLCFLLPTANRSTPTLRFLCYLLSNSLSGSGELLLEEAVESLFAFAKASSAARFVSAATRSLEARIFDKIYYPMKRSYADRAKIDGIVERRYIAGP